MALVALFELPKENSEMGEPFGAMRPILFSSVANQRLPSGPVAIPSMSIPVAPPEVKETGNWGGIRDPLGAMRPISSLNVSALKLVYQRLPSGPVTMLSGNPSGSGRGNSVTAPLGVTRPILFPVWSVNQRLPSGPAVMPAGKETLRFARVTGKVVMMPLGVILPTNPSAVNQRLP